jgi:hypothetical protein
MEALKEWDVAVFVEDEKFRTKFRCLRAGDLARVGQYQLAIAEVDELAKSPGLSAENLAHLATAAAQGAAAAGKDAKLPAADRARRGQEYGGRAVQLLSRARDAGYFKATVQIELLKTDADLDPLRGRDDFKELLAQLLPKAQSASK